MEFSVLFRWTDYMTRSSIQHGGMRPFSNIMTPLTLFNEAPKRKSVAPLAFKNAYLWLHWPFSMRGYETIFPYGGWIFWQRFVRTF